VKYTKATNYALHIMVYFVKQEGKDNLSLQPLASHMNISPTYLSKILTQLVKADLIQSTPGVNGGYILRKPKDKISFYDVIQAIEGSGALFTCEMGESHTCSIEKVMREAEEKMVKHLKEKLIYDFVQQLN
jgi:Rrf2 family protein